MLLFGLQRVLKICTAVYLLFLQYCNNEEVCITAIFPLPVKSVFLQLRVAYKLPSSRPRCLFIQLSAAANQRGNRR